MLGAGTTITTNSAAPSMQARVIAFLSGPGAYSSGSIAVERHETHGAFVFLAGDDAYKIKREVRFSYFDFSTLEKRRKAIEREFAINEPSAPGLYIGIVPITLDRKGNLAINGAGEPVEWALHMRRFDQSDLLSNRARGSEIDADLCRELARAVYEGHRRSPSAVGVDTAKHITNIIHDTAGSLAAASAVRPASVERFRRDAERELARHSSILEARSKAGCVRRCHGDLHLGNIVVWKGSPVLFDAIEFDEKLATVDTIYDLAFLLMDLCHREQRAAANAVLNRYLWHSQSNLDLAGLAALPLFLALRAGVRAMVEMQRASQTRDSAEGDGCANARAYLEAALAHLEPSAPRMISVGGLSGTGKSTLAGAVAPTIGRAPGAVHLRSDLERKAMYAAGETERLPESAYSAEATARVYDEIARKAAIVLGSGYSVIVDAVFAKQAERSAIEAVARDCRVPFAGLWLSAPAATLRSRVDGRTGDASDATSAVVDRQLKYDLGEICWNRIDASADASKTFASARALLETMAHK